MTDYKKPKTKGSAFRWVRIVVNIFLLSLITIPCVVLIRKIDQNEVVTVQTTNIFFAIMLALSSVCFSWARALEDKAVAVRRGVVFAGEFILLSAMLFLAASGMKFVFETPVAGHESFWQSEVFRFILRWGSKIAYGFAILMFVTGSVFIIDELTGRLKRRLENLDGPKQEKSVN